MASIYFFIKEILGTGLAVLLFVILLVFPGYVIAWILNLFEFKRRVFWARIAIAVVISFSIVPILIFLCWRLSSFVMVLVILLVFSVAFLIILTREISLAKKHFHSKYTFSIILIASVWILITILSLSNLQLGNRLYFSVVSIDYTTRVSLTDAVARTGVPPTNPSYFPGHPVLLTDLYYFLYVLTGAVEKIGGKWVNGQNAMMASVIWDGFGLMALISLYLRMRVPDLGKNSIRLAWIGVGSLAIGGLDIIPNLLLHIPLRLITSRFVFDGVIEHWNEKIDTWLTSLFWDPHHIASLIACATAFMLLQYAFDKSRREQVAAMMIAGAAFASALGLSVYVTIVFCAFWAVWLIILFFIKKKFFLSIWMAFSGIFGLILAYPFIRDLLSGMPGSGSFPLAFNVRVFLLAVPLISTLSPLWQNVIQLALLPLNYFLELGFFFMAAFLWLKLKVQKSELASPQIQAEIVLLSVAILLATFVKSTVISNNDFGWRAWLPGQFILLIWSSELLFNYFMKEKVYPNKFSVMIKTIEANNSFLSLLLIIGLATTFANAFYLRSWPLIIDAGLTNPQLLSSDTHMGERTYAGKLAYNFIGQNIPSGLLIQDNPTIPINFLLGLYGNRQSVISSVTAYGVPSNIYVDFVNQIQPIFLSQNDKSWQNIDAICGKYLIEILIVKDQDPLWNNLPLLLPLRKPLYKNDYFAVIGCGKSANSIFNFIGN